MENTMTVQLTRSTVVSEIGGTVYVLSGPDGAVTFEPGMGVIFHDRTDRYGDGAGTPCTHLDMAPCWSGGSGHLGRALRQRWEDAGRDAEVIWASLERRYRRCWPAQDGPATA
jgi:hypothetical protein